MDEMRTRKATLLLTALLYAQGFLGGLAAGDVVGDRVHEAFFRYRIHAPGQPLVAAVEAAAAVLEGARGAGRQAAQVFDGFRHVLGVDEIDHRAPGQIVRRMAQNALEGRVAAAEHAIEPDNGQHVQG